MTFGALDKSGRSVRAALYARVSTAGQDVHVQLDQLRQVAAQRDWTATEYADEGVSGAKHSRPALDRLEADARGGKLDVVAVARLDRLGRSLPHLLGLVDRLWKSGVELVSLTEGFDTTTAAGRMLFNIAGCFAEYERDMIRERIHAGLARARAKGKRLGRPRAAVSVELADRLIAGGHSLRSAARTLGVAPSTLLAAKRRACAGILFALEGATK